MRRSLPCWCLTCSYFLCSNRKMWIKFSTVNVSTVCWCFFVCVVKKKNVWILCTEWTAFTTYPEGLVLCQHLKFWTSPTITWVKIPCLETSSISVSEYTHKHILWGDTVFFGGCNDMSFDQYNTYPCKAQKFDTKVAFFFFFNDTLGYVKGDCDTIFRYGCFDTITMAFL